jgi:L-threonylcarbamoyladenylate synthase
MPRKEDQLVVAVRILRNGGIVGAATETFFGILADLRRKGIARRIQQIKKRDVRQPIPVIIPSQDFVSYLAEEVPNIALLLMKTYWPGPLTIVMKARKQVPRDVVSDAGTIAVRVPGPCDAMDILQMFGGPLTASSLNIHRHPPAISARYAREELDGALDMIIPGRSPGGLPSTLIDVTKSPPQILRRGAVKVEGRFLR